MPDFEHIRITGKAGDDTPPFTIDAGDETPSVLVRFIRRSDNRTVLRVTNGGALEIEIPEEASQTLLRLKRANELRAQLEVHATEGDVGGSLDVNADSINLDAADGSTLIAASRWEDTPGVFVKEVTLRGRVYLPDLPTADPADPGRLWVDALGNLKVSAG